MTVINNQPHALASRSIVGPAHGAGEEKRLQARRSIEGLCELRNDSESVYIGRESGTNVVWTNPIDLDCYSLVIICLQVDALPACPCERERVSQSHGKSNNSLGGCLMCLGLFLRETLVLCPFFLFIARDCTYELFVYN